MSEDSGIRSRKDAHLALCAGADVEHTGSTLLEEVHLLHDSLPELALAEIDLSVSLLGRRLQAPFVITGMTGGTSRARELNEALACVAQKFGFAMGVGSQRAMLVHPETADTFRVRDVAPDVLLLANLGAVQARDVGSSGAAELVAAIHADALCIHLNPAQELVQDSGDRDFRGCLEAIATISDELTVPVVIKETGCGLSPHTIRRLRDADVAWVDVSGAGGTTWTGIEGLRGSARQRALGATLREWGIPTAAAIGFARRAGLRVIASGGIRNGLDAARALALGARAVGLALPLLRAFDAGGAAGLNKAAAELVESLQAGTALVGARSIAELADAPRVLGPRLKGWLESGLS
jgi:isopentenyl-diphosphate delta-isomerase